MAEINFSTGLDLAQLEKDLNTARKAVEKLKAEYEKKSAGLNADSEALEVQAARIRELKREIAEYKQIIAGGASVGFENFETAFNNLPKAEAELAAMEKSYDKALEKNIQMGEAVERLAADLKTAEDRVVELEGVTENARDASEGTAEGFENVKDAVEKAGKRIKTMLKNMFFFSVISKALSSVKSYFSDILKQNTALSSAVGQLKGAFATLATPIINAVIPALISVINWVTKAITAIAQLIGLLTGKSLADMQKSAKAMNKVAGGAKNAAKSMAAFDTVQTLGNSGGGGGGGSDLAATFNQAQLTNQELFNTLTYLAGIIGALIAIKAMTAANLGFGPILGIIMAIAGTVVFIQGYFDAWTNGLDFKKLTKMLAGVAAALVGLGIAFGGPAVAIAAVIAGVALLVLGFKDLFENGVKLENVTTIVVGLGLAIIGLTATGNTMLAGVLAIVAGITLFVKCLKDAIENGTNLANTLGMVAGIIATGLGITLLTGSLIPLLVAAILGIIVAITAVGGTFEQLITGVKQLFGGLIKFLTGVFTGDWKKAWEGVKDIFKGIFNIVASIFGGIINAIIKGLNWVIGKLNKISFTAPDWVPFIGGKHFGVNISTIPLWSVPQLAQGAVIPPNSEFLAVLGDQKAGTNIEAPLDTLVAAFRQVMLEGGQEINVNFTGSMAQFVAMLDKEITISRRNRGI